MKKIVFSLILYKATLFGMGGGYQHFVTNFGGLYPKFAVYQNLGMGPDITSFINVAKPQQLVLLLKKISNAASQSSKAELSQAEHNYLVHTLQNFPTVLSILKEHYFTLQETPLRNAFRARH